MQSVPQLQPLLLAQPLPLAPLGHPSDDVHPSNDAEFPSDDIHPTDSQQAPTAEQQAAPTAEQQSGLRRSQCIRTPSRAFLESLQSNFVQFFETCLTTDDTDDHPLHTYALSSDPDILSF